MRFRPCIDLHCGKVCQIVGSSLNDDSPAKTRVNFSSPLSPSYYSNLYKKHNLPGGHVIMLGPGNEKAAGEALAAWPGGLQVGGGINLENAESWLERGASHVIVTSYVFHDGQLDEKNLSALVSLVGRDHLVLDLSCRFKDGAYYVVTDRWQKFTGLQVNKKTLADLSSSCAEFLVHAVDVEGQVQGVDRNLLSILSAVDSPVPLTYAGGIASMDDLILIKEVGRGEIDVTVGSSLDIFGGSGLEFAEVVKFCGG